MSELPDHFRAIQILAARDVSKGTPEYYERYVLRWFSKTYCTPYAAVLEMPFDDVLQAFYEDRYAAMDAEALELEIHRLLETSAERAARIKAEEEEEMMLERLAGEAEQYNKKMEDVVALEPKPVSAPAPPKRMKEAELPEDLKALIKPDVQLNFATSEEMERLIESIDALGTTARDGQT